MEMKQTRKSTKLGKKEMGRKKAKEEENRR
jgi:hypothetical protein